MQKQPETIAVTLPKIRHNLQIIKKIILWGVGGDDRLHHEGTWNLEKKMLNRKIETLSPKRVIHC